MAGSVNKVILIGNLGKDPEVRHLENGAVVANFSIATSETYTDRNTGQKVENTDWHNIVVKNKAAEICEKYLSKGDKVYIEGRIKTRKWQDDKGLERYTTEILCSDFKFLTNKDSSNQNPEVNTSTQSNSTTPEDDLPF